MLEDGCMPGIGDYLLVKLVSSGVLRADERVLEASIKMSGKLAPNRQSGHGVIAEAGVRCEVTRFGGLLSGRRAGVRAAGRWGLCAVWPAEDATADAAPWILGRYRADGR